MKRRGILGIVFRAGQRRFARVINGAVNGWPLGSRGETALAERETLTRLIQGSAYAED